MPIDRYFKLYLNAGRSIPLVINANQYDSSETWYFTLYTDRGEVYLPSSGAIIGIKADGHIIDNAATVDSRGRVVVTETEQMTAAAGKAVFEISIDDNSHGSANFIVLVEPKPSDGGVLSDSDLSLIQEAIDSTSPAAIAQGVSDWMDEHLTPTTPVVDDTLTVQGAAADAKKTGDEIADLNSALQQYESLIGITDSNFFDKSGAVVNAYINTSSTIVSNASNRLRWCKLLPNCRYKFTIGSKANTDVTLMLCDTIPANGVTGIDYVMFGASATSVDYDFDTDLTHVYLAFKYYNTSATTFTEEEVLNSISVYLKDESVVYERIAQLKDLIKKCSDGFETFDLYSNFINGGLYNGVYDRNALYRVCSESIISTERKLNVSIKNGYRFAVHYFENGSFVSDSGWQTGTYIILANKSYKVLISKVTEDTSVVANVSEFVNAVTFGTVADGDGDDDNNDVLHKLQNARHIKANNGTPLTLLHFSDLHNDRQALARITGEADKLGTLIDGMICTGDMVGNTAEQITSWWDSRVMTCIGNHDTASYNSSTGYNWTALSMADRDAYYISPFKSNWGITHTSGTSYYYKDYAEAKVRLIVIDAMLYTDNGSQASAQTAWLENLLTSAISSNLHVLIAIHAPHGGSTAVDCSFSRYGQGTMPTHSDCTTPQTVIDTVAAKISAGLHFIGYIIGHTHQDNIWDATGDGSQLMYCVTCAIVFQEAQWRDSDMYRDATLDAFNLVTIDTTNSLVKIVRGGGADIDDHMRPRKQICIDYANGEVVSEAQSVNGVYF